jgi:nicotinamide-nucleotide amidase
VPIPHELTRPANAIAARLIERSETVAVAESSTGGLIAASLLSVPGASAYFIGGTVIYTVAARSAFFGEFRVPEGTRGATDVFARYLATSMRSKLGPAWTVAETGAAGPAGNPYGDPAGHSWVAVSGPGPDDLETENVLTGDSDREANMVSFAASALGLLLRRLG